MTSDPRKLNKKKPYQKPTLRVYGDVRVLTQAATMASKNSDGVKGRKTA